MVVAAVTANRAAVSLLARALAPRSRATATKTSYWLSSSAICTAGDARYYSSVAHLLYHQCHKYSPHRSSRSSRSPEKSRLKSNFPLKMLETRWRARELRTRRRARRCSPRCALTRARQTFIRAR